jgi:hypothetical protein
MLLAESIKTIWGGNFYAPNAALCHWHTQKNSYSLCIRLLKIFRVFRHGESHGMAILRVHSVVAI